MPDIKAQSETALASVKTIYDAAEEAQAEARRAHDAADDAADAASAAQTSADNAQTSADNAAASATTATKHANAALDQLGIVEDVVGTLNWISTHATYKASTDTEVQAGKWYFTKSGNTYNVVTNPTGSPSAKGYYEVDSIDEAVSNYVASHLALTNDGLWVTKDGNGYKILLANDGMKVYDSTGALVSTFGESITFDSSRPQRIGDNNAYIQFDGNGHISIGGTGISIGALADYETKADANAVRSRVSTAETQISQNSQAITLKANASDVYNKTSTDALLEVKANKDTLTSEINASADTVKINANRVNIQGVITAINNDTTTTIDGGKITADSISIGKLSSSTQDLINNSVRASDSKEGKIVTWNDMLIDDLDVDIEPIQDLHGYDKPWVGGAGKNKLPMTLASLKAVNTVATWSGNTYTRNGITFTVLTDANDNVTGIRANGTATAETTFYQINNTKLPLASGQYIFNGCPSGGSDTTYRMQARIGSAWYGEFGSGKTFTYDASTSGTDLVRISILSGVVCNNVVFLPMIRLASVSDATFEPYSNICPISGRTEVVTHVSPTTTASDGQTYTTALGRTVYGGTLDVVSGVLTVDMTFRTFNGSEKWETVNQGLRLPGGFGGKAYSAKNVSNMLTYATSDPTRNPNSYQFTVGGFVNVGVPYTVAEWKSLLATNNLQIAYELATPQTYQLTPQQVSSLVGHNTLWTNCDMAHIDLVGVKDQTDAISDASKVATDYITDIDSNNGITIKAVNGATSGSDATKKNYIKLNASGLDIYKGGESVAFYGGTTRIGKADESRIELDYHSLQLINKEGDAYFYVSDLRDRTGAAEMYQRVVCDGSERGFTLHLEPTNTDYTVLLDGETATGVTKTIHYVMFSTAPAKGSVVEIIYNTTSSNAVALTFGSRRSSTSVGAGSVAMGVNVESSGFESVCIGSNAMARGHFSVALGTGQATGQNAVSSGLLSVASGYASFASGGYTSATGYYSHAQNKKTVAGYDNQTAIGSYNNNKSTSIFEVGNGTSESQRSNALELTTAGKLTIASTLTQNSDRRLKEHKSYLGDDAVEFISKLKPVYYLKDNEPHLGFYAQDVEEADKWDCMVGEMNGYKTLGYTELIAPLVAYCQHLEKRIAELEEASNDN